MSYRLPDPGRKLSPDQAEYAFGQIFDGNIDDAAIAAFLSTLADRGETSEEVFGAARAMRARMDSPFRAPDAIDVCGTGGDGQHTLNISTAVGLVVAACGYPVAKHGNRAASSRSGAADVLAALGIPELAPERLEPCLRDVGITFLHAARHHPAMARVAPVRRALGRRTIFNLLGPLANPAGVQRQLIGAYSPDVLPVFAAALACLGTQSALVVHGDGLDELAVSAPSSAIRVWPGRLQPQIIDAADYNIPRQPKAAIAGGDPEQNAAALERLLAGETGAYRDIVMFNAAAAMAVADDLLTFGDGIVKAREALSSGAAAATLARWKAFR